MPNKISRETAEELNGQKYQKRSFRLKTANKTNEKDVEDLDTEIKDKENSLQNEIIPYVPGDFTEEKHRLDSHDILASNRYNKDQLKEPSKGFPPCRDDFSRKSPEPQDLTNQVNELYEQHQEMKQTTYSPKCNNPHHGQSKAERILSPVLAAISNFNLAKKLHRENLEHEPLPDTVTDAIYKRFQMQKDNKEPGLMLADEHFASAVGWKGYPGYGPTRCTKLKVYRPKTGFLNQKTKHDDIRPSSVSSFDKKWRFIRQSKVSPIDLAICWDLTPENPKDEPKPPTHIDGSNGSAAPAVFSLVHTPKSENGKDVQEKCDGIHGCGPIFEHGSKRNNEKEFIFDRPKSVPRQQDNFSNKSDESLNKKRAKSAYDIHEQHSFSDKSSNQSKEKQNLYRSTPNLNNIDELSYKCNSKNCPRQWKRSRDRFCVACELKNISIKDKRPKSEFKMAFKAGIPQKQTIRVSKFNTLKVPKQKDPYCPKNYAINSLAPPFCLQKDKRQEYPEHWRLATVYQHSYKPMHTRKRPLLATVFK